ncbi:MAG: adenosine kinase [Alphaproteobacteria bacterium]|nr:adenosine kinase [Alphaproteobacteria bacterium]
MRDAPRYDLYAIGNALVDILIPVDDTFIQTNELAKGTMALADAARSRTLYERAGAAAEMASGGSAANTLAGFASLGGGAGRCAFAGKIGRDQFGEAFAHDLRAQNIHFAGSPLPGLPTGHCLSFVTPDAQRTMVTHLGAAGEFSTADIDADIVRQSAAIYLEGYMFATPATKQSFHKASQIAHQAGRKVALTLSDIFCVRGHREDFAALIRDEVDILFANEHELMELYRAENLESAIAAARAHVDIAVTTRSEKGAVIAASDQMIATPAHPPTSLVDSTGAGDLYAAGFLFGLSQGKDFATCAHIGAVAAAEVISHYGARPLIPLSELVK